MIVSSTVFDLITGSKTSNSNCTSDRFEMMLPESLLCIVYRNLRMVEIVLSLHLPSWRNLQNLIFGNRGAFPPFASRIGQKQSEMAQEFIIHD